MAMRYTDGIINDPTIFESVTNNNEKKEEIENNEDLNVPSTSDFSSNQSLMVSPSLNKSFDPPLPYSKMSLDKINFVRGPHNRVKLYVLCDQRVWDDRGTGHVACVQADDSDFWCIIVRLEANEKNVLESRILFDTIYQKQQGTLIVWSESDTCDLALSFQEKTGCTEIWDKICEIQGKDPDAEEENECDEQEPSDSSTSGISSGVCNSNISLPICDLEHLSELKTLLADGLLLNAQREKLANAIQQNGYIAKLCDIFQICEDLEDYEKLKILYSIAKNLFLLNSNTLLNDLLDENYFKDIVGMFEYDPSTSNSRKHREFLWEKSKFREVLPIKSEELKAKIHQTYRVQYVLDVCLPAPSLFEENFLTVLSSHLIFNRAEIVNALLNDKDLMKELFTELKNDNIDPKRQRDLTNFLKEFCLFVHLLQPTGPQEKEKFFKALMANDVLSIIGPCISSKLSSTRAATVELLTMIVDFNPQFFRDFLVKEFRWIPTSNNEELLICKLINYMLSDKDPEQTAANQMSQVLRILLDPESIVAKGEKMEFLPMFYKRVMCTLCKPIYQNAKDDMLIRDDYYTANQLALVIDLFCFFVDHHNYSMRSYTIQKNLLGAVLVYVKSRYQFLALSALRMCRRVLNLKDELYFRYIKDQKIIDQIVDCFVANGSRYNLLNSALIEFFEFIRIEEIRSLIVYIVENFWDVFEKVDYVRTFSALKSRYNMCDFSKDSNNSTTNGTKVLEKDEDQSLLLPRATSPNNAQWKKEKEYDNDELFFNKEDDESWYKTDTFDESNGKIRDSTNLESTDKNLLQRKLDNEPMFLSVNRKRKANDDDGLGSIFGGNVTPPISSTSKNRVPKIMICVGDNKSRTVVQRCASSSNFNLFDKDNSSEKKYDDDGESVVSSSSSPPKIPSSTTTVDFSKDNIFDEATHFENNSINEPCNSASSKISKDPIILKQLLLVDYAVESDEEDETTSNDDLIKDSKKNNILFKNEFVSQDVLKPLNFKNDDKNEECRNSDNKGNKNEIKILKEAEQIDVICVSSNGVTDKN